MVKKTSKKNKNAISYEGLLSSIYPWIIALLWIGLTPPATSAFQGKKRSFATLKYTNSLIKIFQKKYGVVPPSLTHLRAFSATFGRNLNSYDGFGQPIDYIWLSDNEYIIRSFGKDGEQNTLVSEKDLSYAHVKNRTQQGLTYEPTFPAHSYPYLLLDGYVSPNNLWHAKLYINDRNATKRLILRNLREKSIIMVAKHERVEQFLWLEDGFRIIYTAVNPITHKTELYLWNILNDRTTRYDSSSVDSITSGVSAYDGEQIELLSIDRGSKNLRYKHFDYRLEKFTIRQIRIASFKLSNAQILKENSTSQISNWRLALKTLPKTNGDIIKWLSFLEEQPVESTFHQAEKSINNLNYSAVYPYLLHHLAEKYTEYMTSTNDIAKKRLAKRSIREIYESIITSRTSPPFLVYKAKTHLTPPLKL